MRKKIILGNWKMNGNFSMIKTLCSRLSHFLEVEKTNSDLVIFPPFPYLDFVMHNTLREIKIGAQNVSQFYSGSYTGEISAKMLHDCGCQYVIIGHSERRISLKENDSNVLRKTIFSIENHLTPVVCLGETLEERKSGKLKNKISLQLKLLLSELPKNQLEKVIFAYEPIWAIGTGKIPKINEIREVHDFIRASILHVDKDVAKKVRIVYGGSLNSSNAGEVFSINNVDGGLVGGASLKVNEFVSIIKQLKKYNV